MRKTKTKTLDLFSRTQPKVLGDAILKEIPITLGRTKTLDFFLAPGEQVLGRGGSSKFKTKTWGGGGLKNLL